MNKGGTWRGGLLVKHWSPCTSISWNTRISITIILKLSVFFFEWSALLKFAGKILKQFCKTNTYRPWPIWKFEFICWAVFITNHRDVAAKKYRFSLPCHKWWEFHAISSNWSICLVYSSSSDQKQEIQRVEINFVYYHCPYFSRWKDYSLYFWCLHWFLRQLIVEKGLDLVKGSPESWQDALTEVITLITRFRMMRRIIIWV